MELPIELNLSTLAYNAKERLLNKMAEYIEEMEHSGKVCDQDSARYARRDLEELSKINRVQAYQLEKVIMEKEDYDPSKDKWGFGPVTIKPIDYIAFLEDI